MNSDVTECQRNLPDTVMVAGALGVDDIAIPEQNLLFDSSNPVQWEHRLGGVASNVAHVVSTQLPTTLIAALGQDHAGSTICSMLHKSQIRLIPITSSEHPTARYTAILNRNGELHIGLSQTMIVETLTGEMIKKHLTGPITAVVLDANLTRQCIEATLSTMPPSDHLPIKRIGLAVSPVKALRWRSAINRLDLFICNRAEAAALTNCPVSLGLDELAKGLCALGCTRFIITNGPGQSLVQDLQTTRYIEPPRVENLVTVNGAGDAFAGGTIAAWLQGQSLTDAAIESGTAAAADVLSGKARASIIEAEITNTISG